MSHQENIAVEVIEGPQGAFERDLGRAWGMLVSFVVLAGMLVVGSCRAEGPPSSELVAPTPASATESSEAVSNMLTAGPIGSEIAISEAGGELPAGAIVAYSDASGLWIVEGSRSPELLVEGEPISRIKIAPDGRRILYSRNPADASNWSQGWHVYARGDATSEALTMLRTLEPDADFVAEHGAEWAERSIRQLEWSTRLDPELGAIWLAFRTTDSAFPPDEFGASVEQDDLWLADLVERTTTRVLGRGEGGYFTFSPDGLLVALARSTWAEGSPTIAVANADGSDRRVLLEHLHVNSGTDYTPFAHPQWTANGTAIRVAVFDESSLADPGRDYAEAREDAPVIYTLGVDGTTEEGVRLSADSIGKGMPYRPAWSADASHFAVVAPLPTPTPIATADPEAYPPPTDAPVFREGWPHELLVLSPDGASRTDIVTDFSPEVHSVSPDGEAIIYSLQSEPSVWSVRLLESEDAWTLPEGLEPLAWASSDVLVLRRHSMSERSPGMLGGLAVWRQGDSHAFMIAEASVTIDPASHSKGINSIDVRTAP